MCGGCHDKFRLPCFCSPVPFISKYLDPTPPPCQSMYFRKIFSYLACYLPPLHMPRSAHYSSAHKRYLYTLPGGGGGYDYFSGGPHISAIIGPEGPNITGVQISRDRARRLPKSSTWELKLSVGASRREAILF